MKYCFFIFRAGTDTCTPINVIRGLSIKEAQEALERIQEEKEGDFYIVDCRKPALTQALDVMKQLYPNVGEPGHQTPSDLPEDKSLD